MTPTAQSVELRAIAHRIADALPATVDEVVVTGSVSRGVADDVSDIEMLIVTRGEPDLTDCFSLAAVCGLTDLGTWGRQGEPTKRVSGYREDVPIELIWWSHAHAEASIDAIFAGELAASADAIANGVALRTSGLLAEWQERLRHYPEELAVARIEDGALTWGGFAPAGLLTIIRPGERLALVERMTDDASRVVRIVFAMNRVWQPTLKRLADRAASLAHRPDRLAERIEEALTEPDPLRAVTIMTELQAETVALAPDGPNIVRARKWLGDALDILHPLMAVRRWDGDERGEGIADARQFAPGAASLVDAMQAGRWIAEEPELHLLPHLRNSCESLPFELVAARNADDGSFDVDLRWLGETKGLGEVRAAIFALVGGFAELSTYVRQRTDDDAIVFEVVTGFLDGESRFDPHGHTLRLSVV